MEFLASEDVIELAKSINIAMDVRTKPLHAKIEQLQAENKRLKEAIEGNALLSGDGLSALKSMASVEFMVKACAGSLSPIDVAESINGIIQDAKAKAEQALNPESLEL